MNFGELLNLIREGYRLLLAMIIVVVILALSVAFLMTPIYRAEVVMLPASHGGNDSAVRAGLGNIGGLASLAGIQLGARDKTEEALATLHSRTFLESFIIDRNVLPMLFARKWNAETNMWTVAGDSVPTVYDGYRKMIDEVMSTKSSASTPIVQLRVDWSDPELAAEWANQLIARLNLKLRNRVIDESTRSIEFLNAELEKSNVLEIRQGIYGLIESNIQEIMLANVQTEYAFRIIDGAAPSDSGDWVKPNRPVIIGVSVPLGILAGILLLLFRHSMRKV